MKDSNKPKYCDYCGKTRPIGSIPPILWFGRRTYYCVFCVPWIIGHPNRVRKNHRKRKVKSKHKGRW